MQGRDKLWHLLAGRITLARTIDVFENSPCIDTIILVLHAERLADANTLRQHEAWQKIAAIVPGGSRRQASVCAGLDVPAQEHGAAIAAVPVKDTIKQVQHGIVSATLDRSLLWSVQTPQVFAFPLIHQAHHSAAAEQEVTDDAALIEQLGKPVAIFPGAYTNIKITTQEDLLLAEALLQGFDS